MTRRLLGTFLFAAVLSGPLTERTAVTTAPPEEPSPDEPKPKDPKGDEPKEGDGAPLRSPY